MQTNIQLDTVLAKCDECIAQFMQPNPNVAEQVKAANAQQAKMYQEQENTQTVPLECTEDNIRQVANDLATETCDGDEFDEEDEFELSDAECMQEFNDRVRNNEPFTQEDLDELESYKYFFNSSEDSFIYNKDEEREIYNLVDSILTDKYNLLVANNAFDDKHIYLVDLGKED